MEGERQQLANLPTVVARAGTPQQDSRSLPSLGERFLDHGGPKATHRAPVNVLPASPPRGPAHESPRCILEEAQYHNRREPLQPALSGCWCEMKIAGCRTGR